MKLSAVLLLVFCACVAAQTGYPTFKAIYTAVEEFTDNGMPATREFQGQIFYQNDWVEATGNGRDRMLLEIDLISGTTTQTLQELTIWEDQFFKYTICNGECAWQDIFAEDPMPQLYWNGESGGVPDGQINGQNVERFSIDGTNVVDITVTDFVTLWVRTGNERWVERAQIIYNKGQGDAEIIRTFTFTNHDDVIGNNRLRVPDGCPEIEPGCFRLDLVFVIDLSGSVGSAGPGQEIDFITSLSANFLMDAKHLACGLVSFSWCFDALIRLEVTYDKVQWLEDLGNFNFVNSGWTCIVGGIQRGFWLFSPTNGSRAATAKALIVITDGNGNRPCNHIGPYQFPNSDCGTSLNPDIPANAFNGELPSSCVNTNSPCNGQLCCQSMHNWHLNRFYELFYAQYNPVIYAIGVGQGVSDATLEQIINDPAAIAANEPRKFSVNNFAELNTIIAVIIAAILCDVPGSQECPNDCRPGGFCCAGGCICSLDCAETESTECQIGFCAVDGNGARCDRGPPQDSVCQNQASVQCEDRFCEPDVGCLGTANTNLTCTDNNVCTIDVCVDVNGAGVCNSTRNESVSTCTDFNDCTFNDECQDPDGECLGTTNDLLPCDDDNECTTTGCRNGTCSVLETTQCEDDDTSDCIIFECEPSTGDCEKVPVEEGVLCAINLSGDNCTVFVCDKFDPEDYLECVEENNGDDSSCDKGECRERTRDLEECESSSDNIGAIIGGVIAGIAFIAIIILLLVIFLLILCRKQVGSVLGNLAAFAPEMNIVTSPTYADAPGTAANAAYDGDM